MGTTTRASLPIRNHCRAILTSKTYSANINFTAEEQDEMNASSRWLRRVVHPFDSFEQILSVGLTSSALSQGTNQRHARRVQHYSEQLQVFRLYQFMGCRSQTPTGRTPAQRRCRLEDSNRIMEHLPHIATRITSNTATAKEIRVITRKVRSEPQIPPSGVELSLGPRDREQCQGH